MIRDFAIGIGIIAVFVALYLIMLSDGFTQLSDRGLFGDSFGALNAIFSGLAFLSIYISLKYQKRELDETLKEIKRSSDAQEENAAHQSDMLKLQVISAIISHKHKTYSIMQNNIETMKREQVKTLNNAETDAIIDSIDRAKLELHRTSKIIISLEDELNQLYNKVVLGSIVAQLLKKGSNKSKNSHNTAGDSTTKN